MLRKLLACAAVVLGVSALAVPAASAAVRPKVLLRPAPRVKPHLILPPRITRPVPLPYKDVTDTLSTAFTIAEPTYIYAHVTTTGRPGFVTFRENIYCEGILRESGDLPSLTGRNATPAEYVLPPVNNRGFGCTASITAVVTGEAMGTVQLWWTAAR
jgi:hypothetical protein